MAQRLDVGAFILTASHTQLKLRGASRFFFFHRDMFYLNNTEMKSESKNPTE